MSKGFNAVWLGDEDPQAQILTIGGVRFIKGEPTAVPGDLQVNGVPFADIIKGNPMFDCDGGEPEVVEAEDEEVSIKRLLDEAGVKYRQNASLESLRDLLAKAG